MEDGPQRIDFKLGWIQGVLIPCLLNIWGVMLFLRISWVVAQAGVGLSLIIIAMSYFVCVITTLSMSALCTNGQVKGGGIYYIISRSLGPEFGASVGIVFAFANAVSASMNTIGFCDSLNELLESKGLKIIDNSINDVRIVGSVTLLLLCIICAVGMDWESMTQNFLIVIIVTAIMNFIIGAVIGPTNDDSIAKGFVGLKSALFEENFKPDFRYSEGRNHDFFSAFAIFFPSVTGIQAGANISGDLKDPGTAIPKGTLLSLFISMVSYVSMVLLTGGGALRDASGNMTDPGIAGNYSVPPDCVETGCKYGIHNSYSVMQVMALWSPLIYGGCWAATLSTALTNVIAVPRLIQALGIDRVYPGLIYFSKAYGRHGEPYRGYILCLSVSLMFLLFMDLNSVAPLITNFFLASYALLNFCTFHAGFISPLGWRPTFRYHNLWLSLLGCLMCVAIMLLINWVMFLVTLGIFLFLYLVVHYRNPDINWGSSTQAQMYKRALAAAHDLTWTGEHVKNYWPQVLVLAGQPHVRPALVDLGSLITKAGSLMVVGDISKEELSCEERAARSRAEYEWLRERKVRAFYTSVNGFTFETGARALMQATGVGRLTPDVLLIGYKANWTTAPPEELIAYFNVLHTAFQIRLAVAIIRISGGLDYGGETVRSVAREMKVTSRASTELRERRAEIIHVDSNLNIFAEQPTPITRRKLTERILTLSHHSIVDKKERKQIPQSTDEIILHDHRQINYQYPKVEKEPQMTIFQMKHGSGTLDVWWLYDDGGMTMLLPYIISKRSAWAKCKLRVFALSSQEREINIDEENMANLLKKFRIDYSSLKMVQDITVPPQQETRNLFQDLTKKFTLGTGPEEYQISEAEMVSLEDKTNRQLRLRELLLANSTDARLIVLSLPMPRKGFVSVPLYMAWLEMLSRDLPPVLFVRGNNVNVLTFYY